MCVDLLYTQIQQRYWFDRLLVEAVTGYNWAQFLQLNILNPLQMTNTYPELTTALFNSPNRQLQQVNVGDYILPVSHLEEFELRCVFMSVLFSVTLLRALYLAVCVFHCMPRLFFLL